MWKEIQQNKSITGIILILLIGIMGIGVGRVATSNPPPVQPTPQPIIIAQTTTTPPGGRKTLQLETFLPTSTPRPPTLPSSPPLVTITTIPIQNGPYCQPEAPKRADCNCPPGTDIWIGCNEAPDQCRGKGIVDNRNNDPTNPNSGNSCFYTPSQPEYSSRQNDPSCRLWCVYKPVVYLYPQTELSVDVSVIAPGEVFISDPLYPKGGWKDVTAYPDGTLLYNNKSYHELFYETSITHVNTPDTGTVIPTYDLYRQLSLFVQRLGLNDFERREFLEFWVPKLQEFHSPYILFSILDDAEKERIDHLIITPKPDTFIAFLAYFKPLQTKTSFIKPLILPKTPERSGFTAVEWGGTIDTH